ARCGAHLVHLGWTGRGRHLRAERHLLLPAVPSWTAGVAAADPPARAVTYRHLVVALAVATASATGAAPARPRAGATIAPTIVPLEGRAVAYGTGARLGPRAGRVEEFRIPSRRAGASRRVWVYTPPGYRPSGPDAGLVLAFDGSAYLDSM